jgi:uncharacterized protein YbbC (DUF1343 family)
VSRTRSDPGPAMRTYRPGINQLLSRHSGWLKGARYGLVMHPASVDRYGCPSAERLILSGHGQLAALFGPEHGGLGQAGAGQRVRSRRHPVWKLPLHSLYGPTRKPTPAMLRGLDLVIFDLQTLAIRPYTYIATLRYVLEACAAHGLAVIVADRPPVMPNTLDGPLPVAAFESFVAGIPAPMVYGMTAGETALWLKAVLGLDVELHVARMGGYSRQDVAPGQLPPWIPPSPAIRSRDTVRCYAATVILEAFGHIDHDRTGNLAFQVLGAPWIQTGALLNCLADADLKGVRFYPHAYQPANGQQTVLTGIRMVITHPRHYRPVLTGVTLLHALQQVHGARRLWDGPATRPDFLDKLYGTPAVRQALREGADPGSIERIWQRDLKQFRQERARHLLYARQSPQGRRPA